VGVGPNLLGHDDLQREPGHHVRDDHAVHGPVPATGVPRAHHTSVVIDDDRAGHLIQAIPIQVSNTCRAVLDASVGLRLPDGIPRYCIHNEDPFLAVLEQELAVALASDVQNDQGPRLSGRLK